MSILVIDVGTSSVRAAVVRPDASIAAEHREALLPSSPAPGLVELDPVELASKVTELASAALAEAGPVDAVGIANQRASTIVWDRATGEPVRSEEHTSELQSPMRNSYAVFCLKKKKTTN